MKNELPLIQYEGDIHVRDHLQFELKSEFIIHPHVKNNNYKQEFYLFIPSALQINSQTYSKEQFYQDQTTFIRYRTPPISLKNLLDPAYYPSPLNRIRDELKKSETLVDIPFITDEIKLFAAIFRASLRDDVYHLVQELQESRPEDVAILLQKIEQMTDETTEILKKYRNLIITARNNNAPATLNRCLKYINEVISTVAQEYLLILLKKLRDSSSHCASLDEKICHLVINEKQYQQDNNLEPKSSKLELKSNEAFLYRESLLNRYILESLRLKNFRFSTEEKHGNILGASAAGIAMFIYMGLLVWNSSSFVINSFPFVTLAVVLYILKDRLKEWLKKFYFKQISRFFPDYSTVVKNPKGNKVGKLQESFNFIHKDQLPKHFSHIRNFDFHDELQALHRHESIMQYKREVTLNPPQESTGTDRRRELTIIFRFNIHHFIEKASNAFEETLQLDPETLEIIEILLPKVYHLNILIQNTFMEAHSKISTEIKAFRVVLNKNGIKRVEHISVAHLNSIEN